VYGGIAGTAISAVAALWAWMRSSKNKQVGVTLAQSVETIREFIKTLPNGSNYDSALTAWLQQHQVETGTVNDVLSVLENEVSNKDAVEAAQQLRATIAALNPSALPPKPPGV
jgi:glycerol-3-phosphate dehydrogenase